MSGWRRRRRSDACADPQGKCRREAEGPPLPLRYALDPHPAAPQCQSANHVSHPAPVHAANSSSTSWGRAAQPWSSAYTVSALPLRNQWLSRNLCDTFCPASLPVSLSNLLAHCDSSMAAIFGAPRTRSSADKPCMPCSSCPRNLICTPSKSLTMFVCPRHTCLVMFCCCGWATRMRSKRFVSCVSLPLADRKCACEYEEYDGHQHDFAHCP